MTFTTQNGDTPEPCATPTNLAASNIGGDNVTVTWDADNDVTSWNIQYRPLGGQLSSATSTTNSYLITGLQPETSYEVQVQADCGDGNLSDWSPKLTVTTTTGIESWLENSVTLFPNPAKEVINVQCKMYNVQFGGEIQIVDVYGKVVVETFHEASLQARIDVSGLAAGMYFVRVTTEEGVVTKSFVKR